MAFHAYLEFLGDIDPCSNLGVRLRWVDAVQGLEDVAPADGSAFLLPIALLLSGQNVEGPSYGLVVSSAIVAAAEALRGPTASRLERATGRLAEAIARGGEASESLRELCGQVSVLCEDVQAQCARCDP
jgi:hypothetical protein